ncbi:winged helix-turn-helix transcriptional regulator [Nostoc sp.]|uniref:winged helix-turn-helix transcriptional regulator n=1 Tax=Nostoc sp. TaxID=1180 RepID=UPI002FF967AA
MSDNEHQECPFGVLMGLLSGPWTLYLIWVLHNKGPIRFGRLQREISGISTKVLTERLRMLEAEGILYRDYKPTIPPEVTYGLLPRGRQLMEIIDQLDELAKRWYGQGSGSN